MELLLGCGSNRDKKLVYAGRSEWTSLVTLDMEERHKPDVVWNMEALPLPFDEDHFDEIHAYEVMEHVGKQGDWRFFFAQWSDFWRILKPGGIFVATSPHWQSPWAWGDPGHTRVITSESFVFLHQPSYAQVGQTPMTDYRAFYKADFDILHAVPNGKHHLEYVLQAIKPSRVS